MFLSLCVSFSYAENLQTNVHLIFGMLKNCWLPFVRWYFVCFQQIVCWRCMVPCWLNELMLDKHQERPNITLHFRKH